MRDVRDTDYIFTATCPFDIRLTLALQEYGPVHVQMPNAQVRSADECSNIVKAADPRLRVASIEKPTGSHDAIIEIVLVQLD